MCPRGLIHWLRVLGLVQERRLSIKLLVSRRRRKADSFPICKLSLFIYLIFNGLKLKLGALFSAVTERKNVNAVIFHVDHLSQTHQSQGLR